uniref:Glyco_hydro_1 n=1 Tax=uncultured Pediococcus sp. TaxID=165192 RepID=A0A060CKL0_9LACO|nr:Glyco_hydro_1 [uncultured Pediococcus sp.]
MPIVITENGIGAYEKLEADGSVHDQYRIEFYEEHLREMSKAIKIDGVNVFGFSP